MVRAYKNDRKIECIEIKMQSMDSSEVVLMQKELISLMSNFNYGDFGEVVTNPFHYTLRLLEETLVSEEIASFNDRCRALSEMPTLTLMQLNDWAVRNLNNYVLVKS